MTLVLERRIRKELSDTFDRVTLPKIDGLRDHLSISINSLSFDRQDDTFPLGAGREAIDLF